MQEVGERRPKMGAQITEPTVALVDRFTVDQRLVPLVKDLTPIPDTFKKAFVEEEKNPFKAPEKAEDINMDVPWSSFGQVLFVKEHTLESGKKVKKVAAVSISYPAGVRTRMTEAIIQNTLSIPTEKIVRWNGAKEGELQVGSLYHGEQEPDIDILDRFIDVSENVIAASHHDVSHEHVAHFMNLQDTRREFLSVVKEDVKTILDSSDFLKKSAFDERYKDKGIYVLEMYLDENKKFWGVDPKGKPMDMLSIAADVQHGDWLVWLHQDVDISGNSTKLHGDGTETVSGCGGNEKACADFFEEMEGRSKAKTLFEKPTYKNVVILPTIFMSWDGDTKSLCEMNCKYVCTCNVESNEASGTANGEA